MSKEIELNPGDKLLISRTDRLGDLILALPFVQTMKARYPQCQVDVVASLYASPILENNDRIDGIVRVLNRQLVSDRFYRKDLLNKIKAANYKAVAVLYPGRSISHLFYKANIPIRIGTAGRFHSVLFNHHVFHSRKSNRKHEAEYNMDFLRFFRDGPCSIQPHVYPSKWELANARRVLDAIGVRGPFVVLHPGSGGSAERWPLHRFLDLHEVLVSRDYQVVMSGSEEEGLMIEKACLERGIKPRKIYGDTDLRTLAAALSLATVVVANSTGPLHLAVAVGTRVVGLYPGKAVMAPARWGPLGKHDRVLLPPNKECTCPEGECTCMLNIPASAVAEKVAEVFAEKD